uniref:YkgJ family cysteine cluster protein n=1 Tax=Arcella intermedia TaxID=1963864 RepID=A0A6B2L7B7_9EUKA
MKSLPKEPIHKQPPQSTAPQKQSLQSKTPQKHPNSKTPEKQSKTSENLSVKSKKPENLSVKSKTSEKQETPQKQSGQLKNSQKPIPAKTSKKQPYDSKAPQSQSTPSKTSKKTRLAKTLKKSKKAKKSVPLKTLQKSKESEDEEKEEDMMEFELSITDVLREYVDGEPPEMQQNVAIAVLDTKKHFLEVQKSMSLVEHAQYVHSLIDQNLKEDTIKNKDNISCKKGCNWCCQQMVFITSSEAELLVNRMKEKGIQTEDIKHLKAQSLYGEENVDEFWALPTEKSSCVFLKGGLCSVYEDRPSPCRTFQVSSHPSQCAKNGPGIIDKVISVGSEIISSASIGMPNQKSGPLPRMVLEELEKQNLIQEE